jgi:SAM-dependent methyltransferase
MTATRDALLCPYCGEATLDTARALRATERQFALGGEYHYAQCRSCGALTLLDVPDDPGAFYPTNYYSLEAPRGERPLVEAAQRAALRYVITGRGALGRVAAFVREPPAVGLAEWFARAGVRHDARILDVGCGAGALLLALSESGYTQLTGVDPFLREERTTGPVRLLRRTLEEHDEPADFIMLHHVLEHVPDPQATLEAVRRHLAPGGHALVRVPIVPSDAWETYGAHWVQLDAPRHVTIPSERGLEQLAERCGFRVLASAHDSTSIQFWGSEVYRRGLTLRDGARTVPWLEKRRAARRARRLNAARRGDQAAFLLEPR